VTLDRHITWENFERDILRAGVPAVHPVAGNPPVALYFRPDISEIGLTIDLPSLQQVRPSPFREINISIQSAPSGPQLKVSTTNASIFRQIFPVLLEVADAVQVDGGDPITESEAAILRIGNALRLIRVLSIEKLVGLWGELWVLRQLLSEGGTSTIGCWHGWERDRHDFRFDGFELEVKTTLGQTAIHTINGTGQLSESQEHTLYVLSVLISRSDRGVTLGDHVRAVRGLLSTGSVEEAILESALDQLAVGEFELASATDKFLVRRPPALIRIDESVPRLTSDALAVAVGAAALGRLVDICYEINFEGLGSFADTQEYRTLLPWMSNSCG
jgi:hypothetical protein